MSQTEKTYDLEQRTLAFSKQLIIFCKSLRRDSVSSPIIIQLVRAGTSIGANYREANGASSKKDFRNKISICRKEAQETYYWFDILVELFPQNTKEIKELRKEAYEFSRIFGKIISTMGDQAY
ncbi:MAG: four helix bundle protein [Candidatus Paceibacterota bacterium]|jgi:four helix bundle protein